MIVCGPFGHGFLISKLFNMFKQTKGRADKFCGDSQEGTSPGSMLMFVMQVVRKKLKLIWLAHKLNIQIFYGEYEPQASILCEL